jgi:hypothetical protein
MSIPRALLAALLSATLAACNSKTPTPAAAAPTKLDTSHAKKVSTRVPQGQAFKGLLMSTSLPYTIQLGKHGDLKIEGEGTTNIIRDGEATLAPDARGVIQEKSFRIQSFATTNDTALVQVDVGQDSETTLLGADASDGSAPVLIDTRNDRYFPIGYYYEDETKLKIRFTPGNVIQDLSQIPSLSRSRPAEKLTLLYRVSAGRSVKYLALSNAAIVEFDPPVAVTQTNR